MKIKVLSRCEEEQTRSRTSDMYKVQRNPDPKLHPFERAREYTRALNAVKLDKMFAKPFIGALDGHSDGIWCMATNPRSLVKFISGACDGEIRIWDLPQKKTVWSVAAHEGFVQGLTCADDGRSFFSCGDDKTIKQWKFEMATDDETPVPTASWVGQHAFTAIDHSRCAGCRRGCGCGCVGVWVCEFASCRSMLVAAARVVGVSGGGGVRGGRGKRWRE